MLFHQGAYSVFIIELHTVGTELYTDDADFSAWQRMLNALHPPAQSS